MRSLLVRIFLSFWLMIVITIAAAAGLGFAYSERARSAIEKFEVSDSMLEASEALRFEGREGLEHWLNDLKPVTKSLIYVTDMRGRDILGRRLPGPVVVALRRFGGDEQRRGRSRRDTANLRPARPFTQLIGTDGSVYTFFVLPPQTGLSRWLSERSLTTLAALAFFASALVSLFLARTISRPVERLRDSASAIGQGKLETRVPEQVSNRSDEIGLLGKEFDRMASELQRSLERQTELTANVSHELRSPLARLRIALELARRKAGDLDEFERIDTETERLDALIGQILEFSRLDARSSEARSDVNLVDLLHEVADDVRFEFGDTIKVSVQTPDSARPVHLYEGAVRGCISNVLRNAAIHGADGGEVTVSLSIDDREAEIAIQDNGGGVATDDLADLFEPFYRASRPGQDAAVEGTGLGLAIAARAARRNGGSIQALNKDDGLLVRIRLPV